MTVNDPTPDKASGSRQANRATNHECDTCGASYTDSECAEQCCPPKFTTAAELRDGETRDDSHAARNAEMLADLRGEDE